MKRPGGQRERDTVDNELPFDPNVKRQAALDGLGIAYLPEDYVRAEIEGRRLTRVLELMVPAIPGLSSLLPEPPPSIAGFHASGGGAALPLMMHAVCRLFTQTGTLIHDMSA